MAVFTIQAPDGRKIKIEAADQATALRGAQEWATANPAVRKLSGKVTPQGSTGEVSSNVQGLDAQGGYDFNLQRIRDKYFPGVDDAKWREVAKRYAPYDAGKLLNQGLTFGLADEAAGLSGGLGNLLTGQDFGQGFADFKGMEDARRKLGAEQLGGLGTAAEIAGSVMAGRPDMAATRAVGFIPSLLQGAKEAAIQGGLYGAASTDGGLKERATGALQGASFGAAVGAAVPAVIGLAKKVISPSGAPAAKVAAANVLKKEGIELTAGQATGNKNLQYREAELGGNAAADFMEKQADQFTAAALKRVGVSANRATPDVVDAAFDTIGQQFDDLAARNGLQADAKLGTDLKAAFDEFVNVTNPSQRPPLVQNMLQDIYDKGFARGFGVIDGEWYKATRSSLGRLSRGSSNPEFSQALRDIMGALDDAMERSISKFNPSDLGGFKEARRLYRNMLVIEDAATRAGEKAADGIITPQALRSAALKQNKRAFARGKNEFVDLANAGVSAMTPLPNSGTPGRLSAKMFLPAGAIAGAGLGSSAGPLGTLVGGVAGAAAPWAAGRAMLSGPGRAYLGNQVAAGPVTGLAAMLGAAAARGEQPLLARK